MSFNTKFNSSFELYRKEILARTHHNKRLYSMPIDQAIETGEVVGPSRLTDTGELQSVGFQFKLRKGDSVKICTMVDGKLEPILSSALTIFDVTTVDVGVVRFKFHNLAVKIDPNLDYFMVLDYNAGFDWMMLSKLMKNSSYRKKVDIKADTVTEMFDGLNSGQENAIESILKNQFSGVIQGPPGTGKTEVLSRLVEIAEANGFRVGILSFTNKAVDNALARIAKTLEEGVVRVGNPLKVEKSKNVQIVESFSMLKKFSVFGATTHSFLLSARRPAVDIIIIDEASQIPSYFLAGIQHSCSNIVMIGDQHQLPPVMRVGNLRNCHPDCFSFYKEEQKDLPMLDTQYRMNETIQDWSSKRYYENKLKAHSSSANRDIFSGTNSSVFGNSIIKYHDESRGSFGVARKVLEYVYEAKTIKNLDWDDIGIISPHRKHAASINRLIQEEFGVEVNNRVYADTVDRYQGREKEFVIYTVSDDLSDPSEFLNDYRRINVAVTRAKSRFYVVSDYRLREGEEFSEFLNWCKGESGPYRKKVA